MVAGAEVDGERYLFVGEHVPAEAVQGVVFDSGDADALPTEALRLPGFAAGSPCEESVEAGEEEEVVRRVGVDGDDGLERDVGGAVRVEGVDDVGVASGDGAELVGVGAGVDGGGHGGVGEAQGAGGEELASVCGADEELECTSCEGVFFTGDLLRVDELAGGDYEGWGFEYLGVPVLGEGLHFGKG